MDAEDRQVRVRVANAPAELCTRQRVTGQREVVDLKQIFRIAVHEFEATPGDFSQHGFDDFGSDCSHDFSRRTPAAQRSGAGF
jgi:hypothetical protein